MSNMLFAPDNASIVEFGLKPQISRMFGHMAEALGLDYWLVPRISCFKHEHYRLTDEGIAHVVALLRHLLLKKGLDGYIQPPIKDREL